MVAVWFTVAPPAFLRPDPPPAPPEENIQAGLEMSVAVVAGQVVAFRNRTGALPATLEEALAEPELAEGMLYLQLGGGLFQISGVRGGAEVLYRSDQSLDDFTAEARRRLQGVGGGG